MASVPVRRLESRFMNAIDHMITLRLRLHGAVCDGRRSCDDRKDEILITGHAAYVL